MEQKERTINPNGRIGPEEQDEEIESFRASQRLAMRDKENEMKRGRDLGSLSKTWEWRKHEIRHIQGRNLVWLECEAKEKRGIRQGWTTRQAPHYRNIYTILSMCFFFYRLFSLISLHHCIFP